MTQKLMIDRPIVVEGKYDKIKLAAVCEAQILTTDGFGIFASEEKKALFRRLAMPRGLIVLTDSDGAGLVIRNYFNKILPKEKLIHLYVPKIEGKEKRKKLPSKEGVLGVEGMEAELLRSLLAPYTADSVPSPITPVTKAEFYADGYSGGDGSAAKRAALAKQLGLPDNLSSNALLAAINLLGGRALLDSILKNERIDDHDSKM